MIFFEQITQVSWYPTMITVKNNMLFHMKNTHFHYSFQLQAFVKKDTNLNKLPVGF
jgi:hypothetical protein